MSTYHIKRLPTNFRFFLRFTPILAFLSLWVNVAARPASAQQYILQDEFNGPAFDSSQWNVHNSDWFIHRTRFGNTPQITTGGGDSFARFRLDTFNPAFPGSSTRGTEIWSKNPIPLGKGVEFETRMRANNLPRGLVMAFYTYKDRPFEDPSQQEIDFEMIGTHPANNIWLNVWTSTTVNKEGAVTVPGLNRNDWVVYKVRWYADRVEWYINDVLVRTETAVIPTDPMCVCYNIWAPDSSWSDAYDSSLVVANSAENSVSYNLDVDYIRVRSLAPPSTPYGETPLSLPGTLQAEDYDNGGEGVAYHDTETANQGGVYRAGEGVDIEAATDDGGGYNVGWTAAGEWLQYRVNVAQAGSYDIGARVASLGGGGTFHIEIDGVDKTGPLIVPDTGGWQNYQTITKASVSLDAGPQVMRVVMDSNGATGAIGNINYFTVAAPAPEPDTTAPTVAILRPAPNAFYNNPFLADGTALDEGGSGLDSVQVSLQRYSDDLFWDGTNWGDTPATSMALGKSPWTFPMPNLPDGKYRLSATARDGAGNTKTTNSIDFNMDSTPPTIALKIPATEN